MKITLNKFFIVTLLFMGCQNIFLGNINKKNSEKIIFHSIPPDSTLSDTLKLNDFHSYIRKEPLNPDSVLLKNEKFNLLPDSLKNLYEK